MKLITLSVLSLSVLCSVFVAGCASPVAVTAPSPTPIVNDTSWFEGKIASLPLIESVSPLKRVADDPSGLETYKGTYLVSEAGGHEYISSWTLQLAESNITAKQHYQHLVSQKIQEGYNAGRPVAITSTLLGNVSSSWYGIKNHTQSQVVYGYNYELTNWWILTVVGLPESVFIGDLSK